MCSEGAGDAFGPRLGPCLGFRPCRGHWAARRGGRPWPVSLLGSSSSFLTRALTRLLSEREQMAGRKRCEHPEPSQREGAGARPRPRDHPASNATAWLPSPGIVSPRRRSRGGDSYSCQLRDEEPGLRRPWPHSRTTSGLDGPTVFRARGSRRAQHSDSHEGSRGDGQRWGVMVGDPALASGVGIRVISLSPALEAERSSPTACRDEGSVPSPFPPRSIRLGNACASERADFPVAALPGAASPVEAQCPPRVLQHRGWGGGTAIPARSVSSHLPGHVSGSTCFPPTL